MRRQDKQPPKTKKYFRSTKSGAGMTKAGVARYRRENPGSKLKTAVTGKVKPGSKAAKRRKSFCARSAGQMKKFPKAAADPNSRLKKMEVKCSQNLKVRCERCLNAAQEKLKILHGGSTGKKPKGSGRRLYTDENPRDTVKIKFATPADARATVAKVKRVNKPFARKIQILTVMEQRAKVMGKSQVASIAKKGKRCN